MSTKTTKVSKTAATSSATAKPKKKPMTLATAQPTTGRIAFAELNFTIVDIEKIQMLTNIVIKITCEGVVKDSPPFEHGAQIINYSVSFASYTAHSWIAISVWQKTKGLKLISKNEYRCLGEAYLNVAQLNGKTQGDFWLGLGPTEMAGFRLKGMLSLSGGEGEGGSAAHAGSVRRSVSSSTGSQSTTSSSLSGFEEKSGGTVLKTVRTLEETLNRKAPGVEPGKVRATMSKGQKVSAAASAGGAGDSLFDPFKNVEQKKSVTTTSSSSSSGVSAPRSKAVKGGDKSSLLKGGAATSLSGATRRERAAFGPRGSGTLDMVDPFGGNSEEFGDVFFDVQGGKSVANNDNMEFFDFDSIQEPIDVLDDTGDYVSESHSIDLFGEEEMDAGADGFDDKIEGIGDDDSNILIGGDDDAHVDILDNVDDTNAYGVGEAGALGGVNINYFDNDQNNGDLVVATPIDNSDELDNNQISGNFTTNEDSTNNLFADSDEIDGNNNGNYTKFLTNSSDNINNAGSFDDSVNIISTTTTTTNNNNNDIVSGNGATTTAADDTNFPFSSPVDDENTNNQTLDSQKNYYPDFPDDNDQLKNNSHPDNDFNNFTTPTYEDPFA